MLRSSYSNCWASSTREWPLKACPSNFKVEQDCVLAPIPMYVCF